MAKTYYEKLRDPRWQRKRLEIMERDGFACRSCLSKTDTLNVHHGFYDRGVDPWDYPGESLITLCEQCHEDTESAKRALLSEVVHLRDWVVLGLADVARLIRNCRDRSFWHFFDSLRDVSDERAAMGLDSNALQTIREASLLAAGIVAGESEGGVKNG